MWLDKESAEVDCCLYEHVKSEWWKLIDFPLRKVFLHPGAPRTILRVDGFTKSALQSAALLTSCLNKHTSFCSEWLPVFTHFKLFCYSLTCADDRDVCVDVHTSKLMMLFLNTAYNFYKVFILFGTNENVQCVTFCSQKLNWLTRLKNWRSYCSKLYLQSLFIIHPSLILCILTVGRRFPDNQIIVFCFYYCPDLEYWSQVIILSTQTFCSSSRCFQWVYRTADISFWWKSHIHAVQKLPLQPFLNNSLHIWFWGVELLFSSARCAYLYFCHTAFCFLCLDQTAACNWGPSICNWHQSPVLLTSLSKRLFHLMESTDSAAENNERYCIPGLDLPWPRAAAVFTCFLLATLQN